MADRPFNVLEVIADQHHADLMGCVGHAQALTPHFDALAAGGMRFTNAYCQNPICTPSRVSILSGQYCHNHGCYGLSGPANAALPNFLRHFRAHGYRTAAYGKLHLPNQPRNWIAGDVDDFGDSYETADGRVGNSRFLEELERSGLRDREDSWLNHSGRYARCPIPMDARPSDLPYEHTQEAWCVREALRFIDQAPDRPFCLQIAFQKPHHPLLPQRRFWDLYPADLSLPPTMDVAPAHRPPHFQALWREMRQRPWEFSQPGEDWRHGARRAWRGTLACISQIDDRFGVLWRGILQRKLADHTMVIYHADHGAYHGIHGLVEKAPGICAQAVCRVPMIWRGPGLARGGQICGQLVENIDIAATLPALCGLPAMDSTDGRDITSLLRGDNRAVRQMAVTENPWSRALRWKQWRFVHYQRGMFNGQDIGELYDIESDPNETRNLYHDPAHRAVVLECRRLLLEWLIETTRVGTVWPTPAYPKLEYPLASDGKEANTAGAALRLRHGQLNYL